jgi:hypothetical protein
MLRPNGLLAVWTYEQAIVDPADDDVVAPWYSRTLGPLAAQRVDRRPGALTVRATPRQRHRHSPEVDHAC